MTFLRLKSLLINVAHIQKVEIRPEKYLIHLSDVNIDGFYVITFGSIYSRPNIIEVCSKNHVNDYAAMKNWVNKIH